MRDSWHFLVSFHLGAWYFFSYCRPIEPIGSGPALWGITGSRSVHGVDPPLSRTEKTLRAKGGVLTVPASFLVQMWRIRTWWRSWWSQHHWDHFLRQKMVFFLGGKTDYFVKNQCWQWNLEPFGWELGCFHGFNNCSQQDNSSLSKCWRKGFKKPDLHQIFYKSSYHHIHAKKLAQWYWGKVGILYAKSSPFFLAWKKNTTIPVSGGQNAAAGGHPLHSSRALGQDG